MGDKITAIIFETYAALGLELAPNMERARNAAAAILGCVDEKGTLREDYLSAAVEGSPAMDAVKTTSLENIVRSRSKEVGEGLKSIVLEHLGTRYPKRPKDLWVDVLEDWGEVSLRQIYAALHALVEEQRVVRTRISGNVSHYKKVRGV